MLVFKRRASEGFFVGSNVRIKVLGIDGTQVSIGIDAPDDVAVDRDEVRQAKSRDALLGELRRPSRINHRKAARA